MGILAEVIAFKQQEDKKSLLDIMAIGDSVESFINIRKDQKKQKRQSLIDDLSRRNIESQIEARKPSVLDELLERGKAFEAAAIIADQTGNTSLLDTLRAGSDDLKDLLSPEGTEDITSVDRFLPKKESQAVQPSLPRTDGLGVGLERTPSGKLTKVGEVQLGLQEKKAAAVISAEKETTSQKLKAQEKSGRDVQRAALATDTAMDEVVRFNEEQFRKFGVKPGDYFGLFDKMTPKQVNEFKAGAVGAGREASATVGMSIIPQARAVRMVEIFSKSSAEIGNTIEGNANNIASSMGNVFGRALTDNIPMETIDGKTVPIQSITPDPETGQMISEIIGFSERIDALIRVKRKFRDEVQRKYIIDVFKRNPDLLQEKTINELIEGLSPEEIEDLLGEE